MFLLSFPVLPHFLLLLFPPGSAASYIITPPGLPSVPYSLYHSLPLRCSQVHLCISCYCLFNTRNFPFRSSYNIWYPCKYRLATLPCPIVPSCSYKIPWYTDTVLEELFCSFILQEYCSIISIHIPSHIFTPLLIKFQSCSARDTVAPESNTHMCGIFSDCSNEYNAFFSVVFTSPHPNHHGSVWLLPVISLL